MEQQVVYYNPQDELDEDLTIDFKKIIFSLWERKFFILKIFVCVFIFFILMTFIGTKKYKVSSDLYINKVNNTNMLEVNPYAIEEGGFASILSGNSAALNNELELMQSALVIDKVIKENDLRYRKLYGFIPTKKTGQYLTVEAFLKNGPKFENKKGTNVITIEYKSKDRELAYNVVSSIINNYIALHQELNTEKAKSDKKILEKEYKVAKANLDKKLNTVSGLPAQAMSGSGNLSAMSAFSKSARNALSTITGQYRAGEKSQLAVTEEASKVSELSRKLEWARLVDEMSDASNVVVLKEPRHLKEYEQVSPKLFTNILLGIIFGIIASLGSVIFVETVNSKLTYSMLGDNILYNLEKDFSDLQVDMLANKDKQISVVVFEKFDEKLAQKLCCFKNVKFIQADISEEFINNIAGCKEVMTIAKIGETDSKFYKQIKLIFDKTGKTVIKEILV